MKWRGRRQSSNMQDRRGMSGGKMLLGGGVIGVIVLLVQMFTGTDLSQILPSEINQSNQNREGTVELSEADREMGEFVSVVLADTEDIWGKIFTQNDMTYEQPQLVLFSDAVQTQCGNASSASGPFYCPADQTVYMDLVFFQELKSRFGAKGGDFAIAYVIAHEIGHHVQTLLGTSGKTQAEMQRANSREANRLSVALELQADFYAGVWAYHNQSSLEEGDIEEALSAANAVGDDAIQERTQGHANQETFTHGSSAQRVAWFKKGYTTGDVNQGDTFKELGL